jgi:hypothetical protein
MCAKLSHVLRAAAAITLAAVIAGCSGDDGSGPTVEARADVSSTTDSTHRSSDTTQASVDAVAQQVPCGADELTAQADTDRDTYSIGDIVRFDVTVQNEAATPCPIPDTINIVIYDGAGDAVIGMESIGDCIAPCEVVAGETFTHTLEWAQNGFNDRNESFQVEVGHYRADVEVGVTASEGIDGVQGVTVEFDIAE